MSSNQLIVQLEKGKFHIHCTFHLNNLVRRLPNRRWNKSKGCWVAPSLRRNCDMIDEWVHTPGVDVQISGEATEKLREVLDRVDTTLHRERFPIWYNFNLPPYDHQREALDYTYSLDTAGFLMDMGTGKTKVFIDRTSCAYMSGRINAVVVACPASIKSVWEREFKTHCTVEYEMLVYKSGMSAKIVDSFIGGTTDKLKVIVCAIEGLQQGDKKGKLYDILSRFMLAHTVEFGIDESHTIKGHKATRASNCCHLAKLCSRRAIMTGTVMSQGIIDLYMQFEFLNPEIIDIGDFYSFRNRYCVMGGYENKQIVGYDNVEELTDLIKPWVYQCTKAEVLDLPEKTYTKREITLPPKLATAYKDMKKKSMLKVKELANGDDLTLVAENVLTQYALLQEITGGFVYYHTKEEQIDGRIKKIQHVEELVKPEHNPKIKEVVEIAEQNLDRSIIIWARFAYEIRTMKEVLEKKFGAGCVSTYDGSTEDLGAEIDKFNDRKTRFFIANQASGSVGLTLNVSDLVIYYSNTYRLNDRVQSEDRNHRIGQTNNVLYIDLVAEGTVDVDILNSIANKQDLVDYVKGRLANDGVEALFA